MMQENLIEIIPTTEATGETNISNNNNNNEQTGVNPNDSLFNLSSSISREVHIDAKRYKTKMCRNYIRLGYCPYEIRCMFAHGPHEMRRAEDNLRDGLTSEGAVKQHQRYVKQALRYEAAAARAAAAMGRNYCASMCSCCQHCNAPSTMSSPPPAHVSSAYDTTYAPSPYHNTCDCAECSGAASSSYYNSSSYDPQEQPLVHVHRPYDVAAPTTTDSASYSYYGSDSLSPAPSGSPSLVEYPHLHTPNDHSSIGYNTASSNGYFYDTLQQQQTDAGACRCEACTSAMRSSSSYQSLSSPQMNTNVTTAVEV